MRSQARQICQRLSLLSHGKGAVGVHPDQGIPGNGLQLRRQVRRAVRHGIQIRHGAHIAVSPPGCGPGACPYILFIGKSRIAEMDMDIDKTRQ